MIKLQIYGPQFPVWFREKPESSRRFIGYEMERIAKAPTWPSHLFRACPTNPDLILLPAVYDPGEDSDSHTLIGFRPLGVDNWFVILMGCDQDWKNISPRCLAKADTLKQAYMNRSKL